MPSCETAPCWRFYEKGGPQKFRQSLKVLIISTLTWIAADFWHATNQMQVIARKIAGGETMEIKLSN